MLTRNERKDEGPAADARLAALLDAAAAPAEPGPLPGEDAALAAFRASSVRTQSWRSPMLTRKPLKALGVTVASAGLLLAGGVAAANAGMLPDAAQQAARDVLVKVGVEVPRPTEHSAGHAETRGHSGDAPAGEAGGTDSEPAYSHGKEVSGTAHSIESGPGKGEAVSTVARGDHGPAQMPEHPAARGHQAPTAADHPAPAAGGHGPAAAGQGGQSGDHAPPVATPNGGEPGTADDASHDRGGAPASEQGTGTASKASGERSTLGSGNKP